MVPNLLMTLGHTYCILYDNSLEILRQKCVLYLLKDVLRVNVQKYVICILIAREQPGHKTVSNSINCIANNLAEHYTAQL